MLFVCSSAVVCWLPFTLLYCTKYCTEYTSSIEPVGTEEGKDLQVPRRFSH